MNRICFFLWISGLTIADQIIKVVIDIRFLETNFVIIPELIEFRPKYNMNYFYLNDLLDLGIGLWLSIALMILTFIIFSYLYAAFRRKSKHKKLMDMSAIFIYSAFICALVSNIFWVGVLDYIYLKPLFIFDLKDLYVWVGILMFYAAHIKDLKSGVRINWKDVFLNKR